jgi:N-acetylglucosaminyl-diphospho-decaprenol L-rhamnosyltransferase
VRLLHLGGHSTGAYYGSEPHQEIARRRREVVADRLGRRSLALDDAAQALTFATRTVARAAAGRDASRPAAQLRALVSVRRDHR